MPPIQAVDGWCFAHCNAARSSRPLDENAQYKGAASGSHRLSVCPVTPAVTKHMHVRGIKHTGANK